MTLDRESFLESIRCLRNNAVLLQYEDGRATPLHVTDEFADMMECSVEEAAGLMQGRGMLRCTSPEDRPLVRSILKNRVSFDGGSAITIQKITAKKNRIWVRIHYSFVEFPDTLYVYCTYSDVTAMQLYEERLRSAYSSMGNTFYQRGSHTLAMFRANLTRDSLEEVKGSDLLEPDSVAFGYTEVILQRARSYPIESERVQFLQLFGRESLLSHYLDGRGTVSQVVFSVRRDGRSCFVNFTAAMTRHPLTGDVVAFLTEQECNRQKVKDTLTDKILARQFDMVCYLVDGRYGVTIGDASGAGRGNVFPATSNGNYDHYINSQVAPVLYGTEAERRHMLNALSMDTVLKEVESRELYSVDIAIEMDAEVFYKRLDFYNIDAEARFLILLKSDTTQIQRQHLALNQQLKEALEAANQASVAKTAFLSSMSHEIRTPMNAIIGLSALALKDDNQTEKTRSYFEKIDASAQHLLSLINDILDMSRIESGRMVVRREEFSFAEMLEQVNTMISSQCQGKDILYTVRADEAAEGYYLGDVMKLKQVLINILGNAVKFTEPKGNVTFEIARTGEFEEQVGFRFTIRDTGIGMDSSYIPHLFDPFSQEEPLAANRLGSTGLGMAITKNLVEQMNGTIEVSSEKGVGSEFVVTLPLGKSERTQRDVQESIEVSAQRLEGCHILLAEDVPLNAEIAKEILKMNGMSVDLAENGMQAVKLFASNAPGTYDAILMDIRMPVMDGLTAAKKIRALAREDAATIPIIALSANAFDEDVQRSLQAGMNAHLSKPVNPEQIIRTLGGLVKRTKQ